MTNRVEQFLDPDDPAPAPPVAPPDGVAGPPKVRVMITADGGEPEVLEGQAAMVSVVMGQAGDDTVTAEHIRCGNHMTATIMLAHLIGGVRRYFGEAAIKAAMELSYSFRGESGPSTGGNTPP